MSRKHYTPEPIKRQRGEHLKLDDRGKIETLYKQGWSMREIAKFVGCSPQTVSNELKRGEILYKRKAPGYSSRLGQQRYQENRQRSKRPKLATLGRFDEFLVWAEVNVIQYKWSPDACVGYARRNGMFGGHVPATNTFYQMIKDGNAGKITPFHLRNMLSRKPRKKKIDPTEACGRKPKFGRSIEERPAEINSRERFGDWEIDTVNGTSKGGDKSIVSLIERQSRYYMALSADGKNAESVLKAMLPIAVGLGDAFPVVFKSITSDNGSEFALLSELEEMRTNVFFAHPYHSWERGQNERTNGMLRDFIPKHIRIDSFSADQIQNAASLINSRPRKSLGYQAPQEVFECALVSALGAARASEESVQLALAI